MEGLRPAQNKGDQAAFWLTMKVLPRQAVEFGPIATYSVLTLFALGCRRRRIQS